MTKPGQTTPLIVAATAAILPLFFFLPGPVSCFADRSGDGNSGPDPYAPDYRDMGDDLRFAACGTVFDAV